MVLAWASVASSSNLSLCLSLLRCRRCGGPCCSRCLAVRWTDVSLEAPLAYIGIGAAQRDFLISCLGLSRSSCLLLLVASLRSGVRGVSSLDTTAIACVNAVRYPKIDEFVSKIVRIVPAVLLGAQSASFWSGAAWRRFGVIGRLDPLVKVLPNLSSKRLLLSSPESLNSRRISFPVGGY